MVPKKAAIFDVTQPPPNSGELARLHREACEALKVIKARDKWFYSAICIAFIVGLVLVVMMTDPLKPIHDLSFGLFPILIVSGAACGSALSYYNNNQILQPKQLCRKLLSELKPLEASIMPDKCIQFLEWCQQNETLKAYQHALVEMGRKPVVGEYRAAKDWVQSAGHRDKEARAREACEQLAQPV